MPLCRLIVKPKAATPITTGGGRSMRIQASVAQHATQESNAASRARPQGAASRRRRSLAAASLPSDRLVKAFKAKELDHLIYKSSGRTANLSLVNTAKYDPVLWQAELRRNESAPSEHEDELQDASHMTEGTITAKAIAPQKLSGSEYVHVVEPQLSSKERAYLRQRGYNENDVTIWSKILTAEDPAEAASIFRLGLGRGANKFMDKPMPAFLPLTLLRRPHLAPVALRDIVIRLWSEMRRRKRMRYGRSTLDSSTMLLLIIRLLRRARDSWPLALVTITQMFLEYFTLKEESASANYAQKLKRHNLLYNRVLGLLALPTRSTPYHAIPHHQRAQFDVIAAMATHDPPLIISREGYQAIASVQAAHQKTLQEQDWSQLKAKSWPPWKQDRTGIDAEKGFDYGSTRAMQVVRRAAEAGYGLESYEKTIQVLAGWDTDRSPTIQTRSLRLHEFLSMPRLPPADTNRTKHQVTAGHRVVGSRIWAARVEATRTVREAWACFLSFQEQRLVEQRKTDRSLIYNAILRKLLVNRVELNREEDELEPTRRSLEPGDHKELLPEPISPKELTWLRADPPTAGDIVTEMLTFKIPFEASSVALLLDKARSLAQGLRHLHDISQRQPSINALLNPSKAEPSTLARIPSQIFTAYVRLLSKYPSTILGKDAGPFLSNVRAPFQQAVHLVLTHPDPRREHLHVLLTALQARSSWLPGIDVEPRGPKGTPGNFIKRVIFWQGFVRQFQSDPRRTHNITNIDLLALDLYEKAVVAALALQNRRRFNPTAIDESIPQDQVRDILESTAETMKTAFYRAAEGAPTTRHSNLPQSQQPPAMPTLLETPSPATIHTIVRLLGFLTDYRGIIDLLTWIGTHEAVIRAAAEQPRSGLALIRRAVVAARVCFERAWVDAGVEEGEVSALAAPEEMKMELVRVVEGTELFGEWPREEEIWRYVDKGRGTFPVGGE